MITTDSKPSWDNAPYWANWLAVDNTYWQWFWYENEPHVHNVLDMLLHNGKTIAASDIIAQQSVNWKRSIEPKPQKDQHTGMDEYILFDLVHHVKVCTDDYRVVKERTTHLVPAAMRDALMNAFDKTNDPAGCKIRNFIGKYGFDTIYDINCPYVVIDCIFGTIDYEA